MSSCPLLFFLFFFLIPIVLFDIHAQSFILIWPLQLTVYLSLTLKNLVIFVLWSGVIFTVMHVTIYICRGKICLVEFICTSDWQPSVVWSGTEFTIETTVVTGLQENYKGKCVHWTSAKCDKSLKQVRSCMTFFFFTPSILKWTAYPEQDTYPADALLFLDCCADCL